MRARATKRRGKENVCVLQSLQVNFSAHTVMKYLATQELGSEILLPDQDIPFQMEVKIGFLLLYPHGCGQHWISVVKREDGWLLCDSLEPRPFVVSADEVSRLLSFAREYIMTHESGTPEDRCLILAVSPLEE